MCITYVVMCMVMEISALQRLTLDFRPRYATVQFYLDKIKKIYSVRFYLIWVFLSITTLLFLSYEGNLVNE
jgi:hypothetical protein